jgi:hypothetical protein
MVLSSPAFIIQSYKDWLHALVEKNAQNVDAQDANFMQDISLMGMIRRIFHFDTLRNYFVTIPAAVLYALPFLRIRQYKHFRFRSSYLCFAMIGVVIFSSSAESSTFVIAVSGIAIWYMIQDTPKQKWQHYLLGFVIVLTSLSATDLFPPYVRENWILPYSLKALPCFTLWCILAYQLLLKNFSQQTSLQPEAESR